MSKVIQVGPGAVSVGPPEISELDILEYALAAIQEYGWRDTGKDGPAPEGGGQPTPDMAKKHGLSIHDAIGLACVQLSKLTGEEVGKETTGTKDFYSKTRSATGEELTENLRDKATMALGFGHASDRNDWAFNDTHTEQEVIALFETTINDLRRAA